MSESYTYNTHILGIMLVATTKQGSQVVFHYPPTESSSTDGTETITGVSSDINDDERIALNDEGKESISNNIHASSYTTNTKLAAPNSTNVHSSYYTQYSDDEFDEDFFSSDDDNDEDKSANNSRIEQTSVTDSYNDDEEEDDDDEEEEEEEEEDEDEDEEDEAGIEEGFDVESEYDSNNPLMGFEEFNNSYFINNILDDEFSLDKLKYKVSYECSTKLYEAKQQQRKYHNKHSHYRYHRTRPAPPKQKTKVTDATGSILKSKSRKASNADTNDSQSIKSGENIASGKAEKAELSKKIKNLKQELSKIFSFDKTYLCEMLTPAKRLCNDQYELKIDNYCFLSHPVNENGASGWSRFYKNKKKSSKNRKRLDLQKLEKRLQRQQRQRGKNSESFEKDHYSSELLSETYHNQGNGTIFENSDDSPSSKSHKFPAYENEGDEDDIDSNNEQKLSMFNIVFVINPPANEYHRRRVELYENILSKLTHILTTQQGKQNYMESEIAKIIKTRDEFFKKVYFNGQGLKVRGDKKPSSKSKRGPSDGESKDSNSSSDDSDDDENFVDEEYLNNHYTVQALYREILSQSALARALFDCYHNLFSAKIFELHFGNLHPPFNIPVKKNFSVLPHSSVKLQNMDIDSILNNSSHVDNFLDEMGSPDHQKKTDYRQVKLKPQPLFISTLLDESFHQNNLFPNVSNLSYIRNYYYLNSFQSDSWEDLNLINYQIITIFKSCNYDIFSLLILDDMNDVIKDLRPAAAKAFKTFIKNIDATVPLKKIIKTVIEERARQLAKYANNKAELTSKLRKSAIASSAGGAMKGSTGTMIDPVKNKSVSKVSMFDFFTNEEDKEVIMISIIYHLIYWEKVKFILPITRRTRFVISPLANLGTDISELNNKWQKKNQKPFSPKKYGQLDPLTFEAWIKGINKKLFEEFTHEFPSLPPLSEFLASFNVPRTYKYFSENKNRTYTYLDACCWLFKNGLIVQYFTFGWLILTSKIKMQVQEIEAMTSNKLGGRWKHRDSVNSDSSLPRVPSIARMRGDENFSRPELGASHSSNLIKRVLNESSTRSRASSNEDITGSHASGGNSFFGTPSTILNMEEEDSILLNPDRPSLMEKRYIYRMLMGKSEETKDVFYKILKYLNGKVPLELVMLKENIKRSDLKKAFKELEEYIITDSHW
ncbi:Npr3 protein [Saccharomycopsis crataegensis]|uniref:Nitrogen permease regulator 3 n=1 Tax=Saccharomycopsis crataegensis TaxID=43959 RepID=A0AAV5QE09_9ASCO|nr:Npr3 protein [Saccharomycopsis crataegensis]